MKIQNYELHHVWDGGQYIHVIWACTDRPVFLLPRAFEGCSIGKSEAKQFISDLEKWYGLPVEEKTIMSHFINQSDENSNDR